MTAPARGARNRPHAPFLHAARALPAAGALLASRATAPEIKNAAERGGKKNENASPLGIKDAPRIWARTNGS